MVQKNCYRETADVMEAIAARFSISLNVSDIKNKN